MSDDPPESFFDIDDRARRVERILAAAGAAAIVIAAALVASPDLRSRLGAWLAAGGAPADAERVQVARVVDGDTLVVADGRAVRVLGIDTPETSNPNMPGPQPLGDVATARLAALIEGRAVALERDAADRDHYGRLLRHVWAGGALVAEQLAREGLGHALAIPPNTRHADRILAAESDAKAAGRGIWGLPRPTPLPIFGTPGP